VIVTNEVQTHASTEQTCVKPLGSSLEMVGRPNGSDMPDAVLSEFS
jgi:hypothetical protein